MIIEYKPYVPPVDTRMTLVEFADRHGLTLESRSVEPGHPLRALEQGVVVRFKNASLKRRFLWSEAPWESGHDMDDAMRNYASMISGRTLIVCHNLFTDHHIEVPALCHIKGEPNIVLVKVAA